MHTPPGGFYTQPQAMYQHPYGGPEVPTQSRYSASPSGRAPQRVGGPPPGFQREEENYLPSIEEVNGMGKARLPVFDSLKAEREEEGGMDPLFCEGFDPEMDELSNMFAPVPKKPSKKLKRASGTREQLEQLLRENGLEELREGFEEHGISLN